MSHLHALTTKELHAEIQRRKGAEVQSIRDQIAEHRRTIVALEARIAAHVGEKPAKVAKPHSTKINPIDADTAVLAALEATPAPLASGQIATEVGFHGLQLKASLARLEAVRSIVRIGKARATVYTAA
jgi:hypothetical protein